MAVCEGTSFLFVCLGNICRSPFAERLAREVTLNNGLSGLRFASAGLKVSRPASSPENARLAAEHFGVRLDDHRSRRIEPDTLGSYDRIVAMEARHVTELKRNFPQFAEKIMLLSLLDPEHGKWGQGFLRYNIPDPYGKDRDAFLECYLRVERCVLDLLEHLRAL